MFQVSGVCEAKLQIILSNHDLCSSKILSMEIINVILMYFWPIACVISPKIFYWISKFPFKVLMF